MFCNFRLPAYNVSDDVLLVPCSPGLLGDPVCPSAKESAGRLVASRRLLRSADSHHSRSCWDANVPPSRQVVSTSQNLVRLIPRRSKKLESWVSSHLNDSHIFSAAVITRHNRHLAEILSRKCLRTHFLGRKFVSKYQKTRSNFWGWAYCFLV